ncbi:hypothetical protein BJF78_18410 [Pseudonocardia sp. CNS-139]|nr:hypothetical protein BJF78_18410 [Pseudonocardia sp. CNS-139]
MQIPVFVGLLHVLTSFNRPGLTPAQNAAIPNYAFGPAEVGSFLRAHLFGVPLPAYLSMPQDLLDAFGAHVDRWQVAAVAVPLVLLAALATHLSARVSASRQPADGPAAAFVRWTPWVFPLGVLVSGALFPFPIATLLYWMTNSGWTVVQQWLVLRPAPAVTPAPVVPTDRVAARRRAEAELRRRRRKAARS